MAWRPARITSLEIARRGNMRPNTTKLSPDVEFHEDLRLLVYRPHGVIDEEAIKRVVIVLEDLEARLQRPFDRFSDTLQADEVELNFKYVIQFSLCRRLSYAGHPPVKSAILARDSTVIHYARLHALLTQGSPIHVRVFQELKEAADWLNVSVERLTQQE
jgi:hypothetical protein